MRLGWRLEHEAAYRETQREWAERVKRRGMLLDAYTAAIGDFMVEHMSWLTEPGASDPSNSQR